MDISEYTTFYDIAEGLDTGNIAGKRVLAYCEELRERTRKCCEFAHEDQERNGQNYLYEVGTVNEKIRRHVNQNYLSTENCPDNSTSLGCAHPRGKDMPFEAYREDYEPMIAIAEQRGLLSDVEEVPENIRNEYPEATSEAEIMKYILTDVSNVLIGLDYSRRFLQFPISEQLSEVPMFTGEEPRNIFKSKAPQALIDAGIYEYKLSDEAKEDEGFLNDLKAKGVDPNNMEQLQVFFRNNPNCTYIVNVLPYEEALPLIKREQAKAVRKLAYVNDRLAEIFSNEDRSTT